MCVIVLFRMKKRRGKRTESVIGPKRGAWVLGVGRNFRLRLKGGGEIGLIG